MTSMARLMPGPRNRDAPRFKGRGVKGFLSEFDSLADAASLDSAARCRAVPRYCSEKIEEFVLSLEEYHKEDWEGIKKMLQRFYRADEEIHHYNRKSLLAFARKARDIQDLSSFDEYCRDFLVIARALERKKMLSERDRDDYFFVGIKPLTLRNQIQNILERDSKWKDVTAPPEMNVVMDSTEQYLKRDRYIPRDLGDDEAPALGSYNADDDNSSSDSDLDDGKDSHRYWTKKDTTSKDKDKEVPAKVQTKATDSPKQEVTTEDLAQRLERLAILMEHKPQGGSSSKLPRSDSSHVCYMCGNNAPHNMKDCPETIAFMASGLVKTNTDGKIVRADGRPLPRGVMGSSGIAKVLKDEASSRKGSASNIEVERKDCLVTNYEFAHLNDEDSEYAVFPAQRADKAPKKDIRTQPYRRSETKTPAKKQAENHKKNDAREAHDENKDEKDADIPVHKILPRPLVPPKHDVDVEMQVAPPDLTKMKPARAVSEPKVVPTPTVAKPIDSKSKVRSQVTFEDIEMVDEANKDKFMGKPKRASPAFKFASAVQESVNQDEFVERLLDEKISVSIRELLSSYEVSKRIQAITKSQKIPVAGIKTQVPARETIKRTANVTLEDYASYEDSEEDNTATSTRITQIGNLEVEQDNSRTKDVRVPSVLNVEAHSDTDSTSTEEKAESYYREMREQEFYLEHGHLPNKEIPFGLDHEFNLSSTGVPKPLAMVTARITGTIGKKFQVNMLLDTGSELNIMTLGVQEETGLPIDPSGANWSLKGVSGHTVELVGLCRNVPLHVGGLSFRHHFFIARDSIGDKDLIIGQPWLYNQASSINYLLGKGVSLQIWEDGDRSRDSVKITIPILSSPRNVFHAKTHKRLRNTNVSSLELVKIDATNNPFTVRTSDHAQWTPAYPSLNALKGKTSLVPRFGNSLISALNGEYSKVESPDMEKSRDSRATYSQTSSSESSHEELLNQEANLIKFGPASGDLDYVSKYATLNDPIFEALQRAWYLSDLSRESSLADHIAKIGIAKGYEDYEALEFANDFEKSVMKGKYKPVAKKVVPVSVHDPDSIVPEYKTIEVGVLPPLPFHPRKLEDMTYTEKLTKERVEIMIGNIPNGFLTKTELELILHVIFEYEDAFAFNDVERGTFSSKYYPNYVMRTVPHVPWRESPIRLPRAKEATIMQLLDEQRLGGKYEFCTSSYRSVFFTVEKKGGKLRIVHDLQPLNRVTIRDSSLPPCIDDMIEDFKGHAFYLIADLKAGYDAVPLAKESRDLTAFHAYAYGSMRLTSLPQGYTNSMSEFCRRTNHMIHSLHPDKANVFVDDILGKGPKTRYNDETLPENPEIRRFIYEGIQTLQGICACVREAGVTISGEKFVAATPELEMLGATVSILGAHVQHGTLSKITKWPVCANVTEVRGFLGTVGVVRRWIKDFAKIARPLVQLTRKAETPVFEWTDDAQSAMERLKFLATTAPPLVAIEYELVSKITSPEFRDSDLGLVTLAVDSSYIGAGWILSQVLDKGDLPILFGSVTFKEHESRYSQPKLELFGLFRALKAERHRLYGIHFRVKVDARSLIEMINKPDLMPSAPGNRWLAFIHLFDFEITHVPAERHKGPDGLSRRRRADDDSTDSDSEMDADDENKFAHSTGRLVEINEVTQGFLELEEDFKTSKKVLSTRLNRRLGECLAIDVVWDRSYSLAPVEGNHLLFEGRAKVGAAENSPEFKTEPHEHQLPDSDSEEFWDQILAFLMTMKLPADAEEARRIKTRAKPFFLLEKILWRRNGTRPPLQVVLEPSRRVRLTKQAHDDSGHRGKDPTYKKLSDSFWWPNQYLFVQEYCKTCHECQMRSSYRNKIPIEPTYVRTILREFGADTVHMPLGKGGYKYIVDLRDKFSGWVEAQALRKATSANVADFIFSVMCRFGCLVKLTVDNGSEFKGAVTLLAEKYNVPMIPISPYNPSANGTVERGHGVYIESIWRVLQGRTQDWPQVLQLAVWADRITAKRTTGHSPYFLLYGQQPLLAFHITDRSWHTLEWTKVKSTKDLLAIRIKQLSRRDEYIGEADVRAEKSRKKAAEYFYERHKARMSSGDFAPGTFVLVWNNSLDFQFGNKGALRWHGPYIQGSSSKICRSYKYKYFKIIERCLYIMQ
jgi:hypothetical protein